MDEIFCYIIVHWTFTCENRFSQVNIIFVKNILLRLKFSLKKSKKFLLKSTFGSFSKPKLVVKYTFLGGTQKLEDCVFPDNKSQFWEEMIVENFSSECLQQKTVVFLYDCDETLPHRKVTLQKTYRWETKNSQRMWKGKGYFFDRFLSFFFAVIFQQIERLEAA